MNYLAHIYLSGENKAIQIGNFMGDAVKGKKYLDFDIDLQKGILLHRQIDSFTDQHPIVRLSKKRLHPRYGHYRGVLIDIFYDHLLAINWSDYSTVSLSSFIADFYITLEKKYDDLPEKTKLIAPKLIAYNWLEKYEHIEGIARTLQSMEKRIKHNIPLHISIEDLEAHYDDFNTDFNSFFPLLIEHSKNTLTILDKQYEQAN